MYHLLHTKRPKLKNPRAEVFQVVILFWPSAFHCGFQVLVCGIFRFVRKQYKVFSIHFKTSRQVTFTSIACWQVQAGGIGMETFRWTGWRDEAKKSGGKRDGQSLCWTLRKWRRYSARPQCILVECGPLRFGWNLAKSLTKRNLQLYSTTFTF